MIYGLIILTITLVLLYGWIRDGGISARGSDARLLLTIYTVTEIILCTIWCCGWFLIRASMT